MIIQTAHELQLFPEDSREVDHLWRANCPGRGHHRLFLELKKDTFTCPWCKRRGGADELREWVEQQKLKQAWRRGHDNRPPYLNDPGGS